LIQKRHECTLCDDGFFAIASVLTGTLELSAQESHLHEQKMKQMNQYRPGNKTDSFILEKSPLHQEVACADCGNIG
jgi:hypothetical protein